MHNVVHRRSAKSAVERLFHLLQFPHVGTHNVHYICRLSIINHLDSIVDLSWPRIEDIPYEEIADASCKIYASMKIFAAGVIDITLLATRTSKRLQHLHKGFPCK